MDTIRHAMVGRLVIRRPGENAGQNAFRRSVASGRRSQVRSTTAQPVGEVDQIGFSEGAVRPQYLGKQTPLAGGGRGGNGPIPEIIHNFLTTQHRSILCGVNVLRQLLRTGSPRLVLVSLGLGSGGACLNN